MQQLQDEMHQKERSLADQLSELQYEKKKVGQEVEELQKELEMLKQQTGSTEEQKSYLKEEMDKLERNTNEESGKWTQDKVIMDDAQLRLLGTNLAGDQQDIKRHSTIGKLQSAINQRTR